MPAATSPASTTNAPTGIGSVFLIGATGGVGQSVLQELHAPSTTIISAR